ncbi:Hydrolase [Rhodotorula toruloides ATCC 204091]|nr:Hydrolase [Rhodotorula toruloides ATCC 204091]
MSSTPVSASSSRSGKSRTPHEDVLVLPIHNDLKELEDRDLLLVDTHTHVLSTWLAYKEKYPAGKHESIRAFVESTLQADSSNRISKVVDVWCEAPPVANWREVVEDLSALDNLNYRFVIGAHPDVAQHYTDEMERTFVEAHKHPHCVGWGEIGLDYYNQPASEVQKEVLRRQLRLAVQSGQDKAITIHTRKADADILPILKEEVPKEKRLHIHCFTDAPELADALLEHFPNLFIGITGVISYASNVNTAEVVRRLGKTCSPDSPAGLRILLETDAPYLAPANLPSKQIGMTSKQRYPFCHGGVLPWTAEFVAKVLNEGKEGGEKLWSTVDVLRQARENAKKCYGI